MLVEIDADQQITVDVENTPSGDFADFRPLAGWGIASTVYLPSSPPPQKGTIVVEVTNTRSRNINMYV